MKVTLEGIKDQAAFAAAGVTLPKFDVAAVQAHSREEPVWLHFGAGNIFRGFVASLQQTLLDQGLQQSGIQTLSAYDGAIIDDVFTPHDKLTLEVTLLPDTNVELKVIGSVVHGYKLNGSAPADETEVKGLIVKPSVQLVSYTITEKGYAIRGIDGAYLPQVKADLEAGPAKVGHAMSWTAALLYERYKAGALPIAMVSMDNCSHNGDKLKAAVVEIAQAWEQKGLVDAGFVAYLQDKSKVSFPWTMIDKITPRPDSSIAELLKSKGIEDMDPIKTARGSFIAPFVNAEKPQYLIVEDIFPNGRPPLEKAGVLFTDGAGVDLCERMKVTTCLNPLHTALAVYGCVLGYERIAAEMDDPQLVALVKKLGYEKNYKKKGLDATELIALPLAIAGWLRYLLAVTDKGEPFTLSDDPLIPDLQAKMAGIEFGKPDSVGDKLQPILSNATLFGVDLYEIGLGTKIEGLLKEMMIGPGAVRATLVKYLG